MNKSKKIEACTSRRLYKVPHLLLRRFVLKRRLRLYSRIAFCAKSAVHRFRQGRSGIGWDTRAGVRRGNPDREVRYELHT